MRAFVDTSAIYAALVRSDSAHEQARDKVAALFNNPDITPVTTSYVVLETFSLLQARIGLDSALRFEREFCPHLEVIPVDASLHRQGVRRVALRQSRKVSLVDCVSFVFMEQQEIDTACSLDRHFAQEGFNLV